MTKQCKCVAVSVRKPRRAKIEISRKRLSVSLLQHACPHYLAQWHRVVTLALVTWCWARFHSAALDATSEQSEQVRVFSPWGQQLLDAHLCSTVEGQNLKDLCVLFISPSRVVSSVIHTKHWHLKKTEHFQTSFTLLSLCFLEYVRRSTPPSS